VELPVYSEIRVAQEPVQLALGPVVALPGCSVIQELDPALDFLVPVSVLEVEQP
jgi:hypothetical protein